MSESNTMEAIVLEDISKLSHKNIYSSITTRTARACIGFCGVCGSDIPRCFTKGTYSFPTVCGHESAGTVEAVADDVENFKAGDCVAVFPLIWKRITQLAKKVITHNQMDTTT